MANEKESTVVDNIHQGNDEDLGKRVLNEPEFIDEGDEVDATAQIEYNNIRMEQYYRTVLQQDLPDGDSFDRFMACIRSKLPATFRINVAYPNSHTLR